MHSRGFNIDAKSEDVDWPKEDARRDYSLMLLRQLLSSCLYL